MTPSPVRSVLTTLQRHDVPCLLMGGQACILHGAGEFSRDIDVVVAAQPASFDRLTAALAALRAEPRYVPPLRLDLLERGHIAHLMCHPADTGEIRLDIATRPPRIPDPARLWERAVWLRTPDGEELRVLSLPDLIATKKTARDKDWAVVGALIDADMIRYPDPAPDRFRLWMSEARDADVLLALCTYEPAVALAVAGTRAAVAAALAGDRDQVEMELAHEQIRGKAADRAYWAPLLSELEQMRHDVRRLGPDIPPAV